MYVSLKKPPKCGIYPEIESQKSYYKFHCYCNFGDHCHMFILQNKITILLVSTVAKNSMSFNLDCQLS